MKFVLGNVLGDAKGANVLCSRYGNNTTSHIARDCDVLTSMCDDPNHECKFHKQKDLDNLHIDQLRELSYRCARPYNAFSNMEQRRVDLFDEQTAFGEYKYNLFIKAIKKSRN